MALAWLLVRATATPRSITIPASPFLSQDSLTWPQKSSAVPPNKQGRVTVCAYSPSRPQSGSCSPCGRCRESVGCPQRRAQGIQGPVQRDAHRGGSRPLCVPLFHVPACEPFASPSVRLLFPYHLSVFSASWVYAPCCVAYSLPPAVPVTWGPVSVGPLCDL